MNDGLIRKSSGSGTAVVGSYSFGINADQPTSYEVDSGTLQFAAEGSWSDGGTFTVAKGATLQFGGGSTLSQLWLGGTFTGSGIGRRAGGILQIGPSAQLNQGDSSKPYILHFPSGFAHAQGAEFDNFINTGAITVDAAGLNVAGGVDTNSGNRSPCHRTPRCKEAASSPTPLGVSSTCRTGPSSSPPATGTS